MIGDLRARLLQFGAATLTDAELVAVLLSAGGSGEKAVARAEQVLTLAGGLPGLASSHPETLARLVAALALPARRDPRDLVTVARLEDYLPVFRPLLCGLRHERLAVAVCDRRCRVRAVRAVGDGTTDAGPFPVRDIVATVLRHDGHAFAVAHNHPSGNVTPSRNDLAATARCRHAAAAAGLDFHGHLVIGDHASWHAA